MKKTIALIIAATMVVCLTGCNKTYHFSGTEIKVDNSSKEIADSSENDEKQTESASSKNESTSSKSTSSVEKSSSSSVTSNSSFEAPRPEKVTKVYNANISYSSSSMDRLIFKDSANKNELPYRLSIPKNYDKSKKYPVVLFLHGAGEIGDDNKKQLSNLSKLFKFNGDFIEQSILICPQTSVWWNLDNGYDGDGKGTLTSAYHLLQEIMKKYSCDKDRIYLTGLSMGGNGVWEMLGRYGDTFAAAIPLCAPQGGFSGDVYKNIPIRIYHGTSDKTVSINSSQYMYNRIVNAGGKKVEFIKLTGYDHNVWDYVYGNREIISWLFAQNKSTNPTMKYEISPYFKVVDKNGKTVISDKDLVSHSFPGKKYGSDFMECKIYLTESGKTALGNAYKSGGEFTVYLLNTKIYSYTASTPPIDRYFVITNVFNTSNYNNVSDLLSAAAKLNNK